MDEKKKRAQCKPIPMQDTGPKASQENPDQAEKFHGEQSGPGMTRTKVPGEGTPGMPGMTSARVPND